MTITIVPVHRPEIETYRRSIVAVYRDAFAQPPYLRGRHEVREFARSLPDHAGRPGFRLLVALEGETQVVGFAYGLDNHPGQWWYDEVAPALDAGLVRDWLEGALRLAEIAVIPQAQGQGIGGRLHDELLRDVPHRTAVLSTMSAPTTADAMYRRRGWQVLLDPMHFAGVIRPYRILGLRLPLLHPNTR